MDMHFGFDPSSSHETKFSTLPTFPAESASLPELPASELDLAALRVQPPEDFAKYATLPTVSGLMSPSQLDLANMSISGHHSATTAAGGGGSSTHHSSAVSSSPSMSSAAALAHHHHLMQQQQQHQQRAGGGGSMMSSSSSASSFQSNALTSPHISTSASLSSALHGHHHRPQAMSAAAVATALSAAAGGSSAGPAMSLSVGGAGGHNPLSAAAGAMSNTSAFVDSSMVPSLDFNLPRMRAMSATNTSPHQYHLRGARRRAVSEADQHSVVTKSARHSLPASPRIGGGAAASPRAPGSSHSSAQNSPQHGPSRESSASPHSSSSTPVNGAGGAIGADLSPFPLSAASIAANGARSHPSSPHHHARRSPHASPPLLHRPLSVTTSHRSSVASLTRASNYGAPGTGGGTSGGGSRSAASSPSAGGGRRRAKSKGDAGGGSGGAGGGTGGMGSPQVLKKSRKRVPVACVPCNKAKTSCSGSRPCHRCLTRRHPEQCIDVVHRKKGRPKKVNRDNTGASGVCLSPLGGGTTGGGRSPVLSAKAAGGHPPPYLHLPPPPATGIGGGGKYGGGLGVSPPGGFGGHFGGTLGSGGGGAQFNMSMPGAMGTAAAGTGGGGCGGTSASMAPNARGMRFKFELNAEMSDFQPGATMSGSVSLQPLTPSLANGGGGGGTHSLQHSHQHAHALPSPLPLTPKAPSPVVASPANANLPKSKVYYDTWQKAWDSDTLSRLLREAGSDRAVPAKVCFAFSLLSASLLDHDEKDRLRKLITDNLKSIGFDVSSPLPVHEVDYELDPAPSKPSQFPALNLRYSVTDANRVKVLFSSSSFDHSFHYKRADFVALLEASVKERDRTAPATGVVKRAATAGGSGVGSGSGSEKFLKEEEITVVRSIAPFWWRTLLNKDTDLIVLMEQRALAGRMTNDGCVVNLMLKTGSVVKCAANISCNEQELPKVERNAAAADAAASENVKMEDDNVASVKGEAVKAESGVGVAKLEPSPATGAGQPRSLAGFSACLSYAFVPIPQSVKAEPPPPLGAAHMHAAAHHHRHAHHAAQPPLMSQSRAVLEKQAASLLGLAPPLGGGGGGGGGGCGLPGGPLNMPPASSPHALPSFFPHHHAHAAAQPFVFPHMPQQPHPHAPGGGGGGFLMDFGRGGGGGGFPSSAASFAMSDIPDPTTNAALMGFKHH